MYFVINQIKFTEIDFKLFSGLAVIPHDPLYTPVFGFIWVALRLKSVGSCMKDVFTWRIVNSRVANESGTSGRRFHLGRL